MKPAPGPWGLMAGMPANLLDATGRRIAWFNGDDYQSDSTPEDEANAALVLELRDTLAAVYDTFFGTDPREVTPEECAAVEARMTRVLAVCGVAAK